ncbi:MAG: SRPBCC domain-containing protein [Pseudomonadota bacterium]
MPVITRDVFLPHPVQTVWAALTDPDQLAIWLMPNDFQPVLGHRFTFRTDPAPGFDGIVHCEVLELIPTTRLVFSWMAGKVDTRVTFALAEEAAGTRLRLRHEGFGLTQLPVRMLLSVGWKRILRTRLPAHLDTRQASTV